MNLSPTIKDRIQTLLREKIRADEHFKDGYEELPQHTGETERWPKRGAFGFVHRMLRMEDPQFILGNTFDRGREVYLFMG